MAAKNWAAVAGSAGRGSGAMVIGATARVLEAGEAANLGLITRVADDPFTPASSDG